MDQFMEHTIKLAANNVKEGGQPFGAALIKDGEVIAEGVNQLHVRHDVSGHAEMVAIRQAQKQLQTDDLSDMTMYASGEPCPMCYAAMSYAGIQTTYYAQSAEDAVDAGLGKSKQVALDLQKAPSERSYPMHHMPLTDDSHNPMQMYKKRHNQ
ncbi:tRNA(Arg) A34 adenosine deaminase TadA [Alkalibacillus flavidus]|uniref:tRNA(Arg) A34 adenosine deaminase TadA n=1 Tax=Alkalibacillus flavidus TaxID=546021 RepID=A0ABV2KT85_9BACI